VNVHAAEVLYILVLPLSVAPTLAVPMIPTLTVTRARRLFRVLEGRQDTGGGRATLKRQVLNRVDQNLF